MKFLINATNLNEGGGVQVTQSLCGQLYRFKQHKFIVVLSTYIDDTEFQDVKNIQVLRYDIKNNISTILWGRDSYLDNLVTENNIDAVLSVFGPSRWCPRVRHLCGFARAQLVLNDSPYNRSISFKEKLKYFVWTWSFRRSSKVFYTENKYISELLPALLGKVDVHTVTNYYNQIFDMPESWTKTKELPPFNGITCLSVSTHYLHKNFEIIARLVKEMRKSHPNFHVRFVLTFEETEMPVPEDVRDAFVYIGPVNVSECPNLYQQADIMFMPTLMECFTATYPEAMRMEVPIITTDLEFAHGLCGDAACYYSAEDPKAAAEAIYKVATDKEYAKQLVANGKKQLLRYDNYGQRADKLIKILEEMVNNNPQTAVNGRKG